MPEPSLVWRWSALADCSRIKPTLITIHRFCDSFYSPPKNSSIENFEQSWKCALYINIHLVCVNCCLKICDFAAGNWSRVWGVRINSDWWTFYSSWQDPLWDGFQGHKLDDNENVDDDGDEYIDEDEDDDDGRTLYETCLRRQIFGLYMRHTHHCELWHCKDLHIVLCQALELAECGACSRF